MPKGFQKISYNVTEKSDEELRSIGTATLSSRGIGRRRDDDQRTFTTDEAAARFYVGQVLSRDERPRVRTLGASDQAATMPDLRLRATQQVPSSSDRLVTFDQTVSSIPIFGSRVVVQLNRDRELVNLGGDMALVGRVSPVAALSPADALDRIAKAAGVDASALADVSPPTLTFYCDQEKETWHLAYLCSRVPAAPAAFIAEMHDHKGHGLGSSPRQRRPLMNYLVDAHDGAILLYYSATPTITVPSECLGDGEGGNGLEFWGLKLTDEFEMSDPRRAIKTYDMRGQDIDRDPVPHTAVRNASNNWQSTNKAAVSAHVNATKVYDFYKSVLLRDSIDDKGMDLVSIVNCTYSADEPPPQWHNAVWYDNKMWYGQDKGSDGQLRSYSRFLDVIAHELTHGVTEYTSNLVYKNQSGALNESFSDIFGIVIANWDPRNPDRDVSSWTWQLGAGLGSNGTPLRDLSDPRSTGDPDHMNDYLVTTRDSGGVHTNSNIHNKAAYNVFTATDASGARVFRPMEAAELFYLTLSRLSNLATFSDTLDALIEVAAVYYAGNPQKRDDRIQHIKSAYQKVGITNGQP
jgi:bacillolysin/neutral peptidase B